MTKQEPSHPVLVFVRFEDRRMEEVVRTVLEEQFSNKGIWMDFTEDPDGAEIIVAAHGDELLIGDDENDSLRICLALESRVDWRISGVQELIEGQVENALFVIFDGCDFAPSEDQGESASTQSMQGRHGWLN